MDKLGPMGDVFGKPLRDQLLLGEDVALKSRKVLCRRGRSGVRVRVVGGASLAWLEAAEAWGCHVEAVVVSDSREIIQVIHLVSLVTTTTVSEALKLPPLTNDFGMYCIQGVTYMPPNKLVGYSFVLYVA